MIKLNNSALTLLAAILAASNSEQGHGFVVESAPATKALVDAGYIETNSAVTGGEGGKEIAARITDAGRAYAKTGETGQGENGGAALAGNDGQGASAGGKVSTPRKKLSFEIEENVLMPEKTRAAPAATYPFDDLEIGKSFFLADTDTKSGDAFKTLSTAINNANKRHSEPTGEFRPHRRDANKKVEVVKPTRLFEQRRMEKDGVTGSRVFRVELPEG